MPLLPYWQWDAMQFRTAMQFLGIDKRSFAIAWGREFLSDPIKWTRLIHCKMTMIMEPRGWWYAAPDDPAWRPNITLIITPHARYVQSYCDQRNLTGSQVRWINRPQMILWFPHRMVGRIVVLRETPEDQQLLASSAVRNYRRMMRWHLNQKRQRQE